MRLVCTNGCTTDVETVSLGIGLIAGCCPRFHQDTSSRNVTHGVAEERLLTLVAHSVGHGSGTRRVGPEPMDYWQSG